MRPDLTLFMCPPWTVQAPPAGLGQLCAAATQQGLRVAVEDLNIACYHTRQDMQPYWEGAYGDLWNHDDDFIAKVMSRYAPLIDAAVARLTAAAVPVAGFSVSYSNYVIALEVAAQVRRAAPGTKIIFGGTGCFFPEPGTNVPHLHHAAVNHLARFRARRDEPLVDIFVRGRGELILPRILQRLRAGEPLAGLPGVVSREDNFTSAIPPEPITDLDALPFPTYAEFPLAAYTERVLPLTMSYGCIGGCTFCNDHVITGKFRTRSAEHIFREICFHTACNNTFSFQTTDLLLNGSIPVLERLCDLLIAAPFRVSWGGHARVRQEMSPALLHKMARAGCNGLVYGIESFSPRVTRLMHKGVPLDEVMRCLRDTRAAGIPVHINLIVGYPGETAAEVAETLRGIRAASAWITSIGTASPCILQIGSPLAQQLAEEGGSGDYQGREGPAYRERLARIAAVIRTASWRGIAPEHISAPREDLESIGFNPARYRRLNRAVRLARKLRRELSAAMTGAGRP